MASGKMKYPELTTVSLNISSGWNAIDTDLNKARKSGRIVTVDLGLNTTATPTPNSWNVIGTLPTGYLPPSILRFIAFNDIGNSYILMFVHPNGNVAAYVHNETSIAIRQCVTYLI